MIEIPIFICLTDIETWIVLKVGISKWISQHRNIYVVVSDKRLVCRLKVLGTQTLFKNGKGYDTAGTLYHYTMIYHLYSDLNWKCRNDDGWWWMDTVRIVTFFVASSWSNTRNEGPPLVQQFPLIQKWFGARHGWTWFCSPNCKMAPVFAAMRIKWASDSADNLLYDGW